MKQGRKWGIRGKVITAILIVGILPGIAGLFLTYIGATNIMKASIGDSFQELAITTATKIDMIIEHELHEVKKLAITPLIVSSVEEANRHYKGKDATRPQIDEVAKYLSQFMKLEPEEYLNIMVTNERGGLVATVREPERSNYHSEGWWRAGYNNGKGDVYISDINLDPETSTYYIRFSAPIMDKIREKVIGVLAIDYNVGYIFTVILDIKMGTTGHANLIDSEGNLVIDPVVPIMGLRLKEWLLNAVARDEPGWTIADDEHGGEDAVLGFAPVLSTTKHGVENFGGKRWYIFIGLDPHETYAPIYSMLVRISLVGLMIVGALSLLGLYISRRLIKPIQVLHKGAEIIGSGNLDYHLDIDNIDTNDEIEELAEGFNEMAERLKNMISEQRRLERQMAEAEKLAALGQFSAGIAHEIRNPLSSIKMGLDILSRRLKPEGNDKVRLDVAREEVARLEMLIQDILLYAKPPELRLAPEDINTIVEDSLKVMEGQFNGRKVGVTKDYAKDLLPVSVDHGRLKQALLNIFLNSLQAIDSRDGGGISIRTGKDGHMGREVVRVEVSDNGCGIKKEDMKNIFNPFFTTKGEGTGLGLANVKTIVEQHRGAVEIKSKEGEGTTVTIFLPVESSRKGGDSEGEVKEDTYGKAIPSTPHIPEQYHLLCYCKGKGEYI